MKRIAIALLEPGMILAEAIYNEHATVELLREGMAIKDNHISMMRHHGISDVLVYELGEFERKSQGGSDDAVLLSTNLASEIDEVLAIDYDAIVTSVCNRNMQIQLLTGEGNLPIDQKHAAVLQQTKETFEQIRNGGPLNREALEEQVSALLPDMIRNNDILMRLNQLKSSDDYLFNHALRVSMLASMIGKWLGYDVHQLKDLALAGLLFDLGKLKLPEEILFKEGPLTEAEFSVAQKHAQLGYLILLKTAGVSQDVKFAALQHHERIDGTGYPLRVQAGQIHEYSKIIMVCDTFDAMIQDRVYKKKVSPFQAAEYISWHSGSAFDARICYVFLSNLADFYMGKECVLSNGQRGRIVYIDVNEPIRPIIQIDNQFIDLTKRRDLYVAELD